MLQHWFLCNRHREEWMKRGTSSEFNRFSFLLSWFCQAILQSTEGEERASLFPPFPPLSPFPPSRINRFLSWRPPLFPLQHFRYKRTQIFQRSKLEEEFFGGEGWRGLKLLRNSCWGQCCWAMLFIGAAFYISRSLSISGIFFSGRGGGGRSLSLRDRLHDVTPKVWKNN